MHRTRLILTALILMIVIVLGIARGCTTSLPTVDAGSPSPGNT